VCNNILEQFCTWYGICSFLTFRSYSTDILTHPMGGPAMTSYGRKKFVAPEVLQSEIGRIDSKSDVWTDGTVEIRSHSKLHTIYINMCHSTLSLCKINTIFILYIFPKQLWKGHREVKWSRNGVALESRVICRLVTSQRSTRKLEGSRAIRPRRQTSWFELLIRTPYP